MNVPSSKYTVIVETKSVDLWGRECYVTRYAKDFDDLELARQHAQERRDKWVDPTTRVRVEVNDE
jgi:hypothetical protein